MKRFIIAFLFGLLAFGIVNVAASIAMSDDFDTPDAMLRFGFPFVYKQETGPVSLNYFSCIALFGDIAVALAASALNGLLWARNHTFERIGTRRGRIHTRADA